MADEVISIPEIFAPFGIRVFGTPNLDATRAINAAYRAEVRDNRALCNAGGGLVGGAGSECYFGQAAYDKAQQILAGEAPNKIKNKAQSWLDANPDFGEEIEDGTEGEQPDEFQGLYDKYGKDVVDDAREKYDEVVKVLGESAEDPFGAIEKIISTVSSGTTECTQADLPDWIRNCVTVGVLYGIPGLPLPPIPGVLGTTIGEIEDAMKEVGASVQDIFDGAETCGEEGNELCTWEDAWGRLKDWVIEKAGDALPDFTDPDDIGGWLKDILGPTLGGVIFGEIGDQLEDLFFEGEDPNDEDKDLLGGDPCLNDPDNYEVDPETGKCVKKGSVPDNPLTPQEECELNQNKVWNEETQECEDIPPPSKCGEDEYEEDGECKKYSSVDDDDDDGLNSIERLCAGPRPAEYGFEQINWDKYCGGAGPECPEGQTYDSSLDQCVDKEELSGKTEEEETVDGGGGGGGGGGSYESKIVGLSYELPPVTSLFGASNIDAVGELNNFIGRQAQRKNNKDPLFS